MKTTITRFLIIFFLTFSLNSCEDVVEMDLDTAERRLVVNASLEWQKGTEGNYQFIELTTTADFYEDTPPPVTDATVTVLDAEGNNYYFEERETPGHYECFDFNPRLDQAYELEINYNGETFIATESLQPVVSFEQTEQTTFDGITEEIEVRAFFTDPGNRENYYLVEDINSNQTVPGYFPFSDHFFNGNKYFSSHFAEELEPQDEVRFKIFGISSRHHDYLVKLTNSYMGGPFQTVSGVLHGNIRNISNEDNYALGYFSLSQTDTITHVIE